MDFESQADFPHSEKELLKTQSIWRSCMCGDCSTFWHVKCVAVSTPEVILRRNEHSEDWFKTLTTLVWRIFHYRDYSMRTKRKFHFAHLKSRLSFNQHSIHFDISSWDGRESSRITQVCTKDGLSCHRTGSLALCTVKYSIKDVCSQW